MNYGRAFARALGYSQRASSAARQAGVGSLGGGGPRLGISTRPRCTARCRDGHACQAAQLGHLTATGYEFTGYCGMHGKEQAMAAQVARTPDPAPLDLACTHCTHRLWRDGETLNGDQEYACGWCGHRTWARDGQWIEPETNLNLRRDGRIGRAPGEHTLDT